jgi:hypothetical protein
MQRVLEHCTTVQKDSGIMAEILRHTCLYYTDPAAHL